MFFCGRQSPFRCLAQLLAWPAQPRQPRSRLKFKMFPLWVSNCTLSCVFGDHPLSEGILRQPSIEDSANHLCFCSLDGIIIQFGDCYWLIIETILIRETTIMLGDIVFPSTMFQRWGQLNVMVSGARFHAVSKKYWLRI